MIITIKADVDISNELRDLNVSQLWDLLEIVWDLLEKDGAKYDWESFYDENGLIKHPPTGEDG